ncbi:MAG TPA: SDR family NAD(P)-dependent oxidoreductase [Chlamydiales bacterium]|nr:SDR family NAD(P)-dependent oxidoreductase [Chlamydiales bacterium]
MSKKAIIIGASSGIGKELAYVLSTQGYTLGLAARRVSHLEDLKKTLPNECFLHFMDIQKTHEATSILEQMIQVLDGVDLIILSSGIGDITSSRDWGHKLFNWDKEEAVLKTNVLGYTAILQRGYQYFMQSKKKGHIVTISSLASLFANPYNPAYSASKAFINRYVEGLIAHSKKNNLSITFTNILPGFVNTKMAQGPKVFWKDSPQEAAKQIYQAIRKKKSFCVITKKWKIFYYLIKLLPNALIRKIV